ncbi:MAG: ribonuclease [Fusobacteriaceae bacterium]|jgi:ribonuclease J|nr:RNA-metabolising metallo-beta-lactamase [Fusobacteriales bacterium]MDN5305066.1 ribonuclease [Fusobacteriaceae bacterium]
MKEANRIDNKIEKTKNNDKPKKEEKVYVMPLGGLEEVGKNSTIIQYRDEIIIIDAGSSFPDENLYGIDLVIPEYSYLEKNKDKVKGLILTHGHEDHIGAIPYLYQKIDSTVPIYGGKLSIALAMSKFDNFGGISHKPKTYEVSNRSVKKIGKYFEVEFIRVTHSIADAYSICINTPAGRIVHTGDFKIDLTPVDNVGVDFHRLAALGEEGVDLLLADSTNAEIPGFTPSERSVGDALRNEFRNAKGRIIVAAFASHIHRLQQIVDVANETNRKIAIDGRSMVKVFEIATKLGYLEVPKGIMVSLKNVESRKDNEVVILCTGTQGEPLAALSRIAKNMHRHITIREEDTVIISATPIPGNEKAVYSNINNLLKKEAEVVFKKVAGIHVSGHGSQDELKLMLNLIKPKNFMPIHGEYKMLKAHKQLAIECGIPAENIIITENGRKIELTKEYAREVGKIPSGDVLIDGLGVGDVGNIVLRDRQHLAQDGIVIVVITISKETGMIVSGPDIITRGFVYSRESETLINEAIKLIREKLEVHEKNNVTEWNILKGTIKDTASKYLYDETKRNPIILPIIMEV